MSRFAVVLIVTLLSPSAWSQADDLAAERARLANQRINAEARAREEQERLARQVAERERDDAVPRQMPPPAAPAPPGTDAEPATPAPRIAAADAAARAAPPPAGNVDRLLEQIRTLGELRDAGYVTDAEFERIKQRILDGTM